jgi:hypothetical protein
MYGVGRSVSQWASSMPQAACILAVLINEYSLSPVWAARVPAERIGATPVGAPPGGFVKIGSAGF